MRTAFALALMALPLAACGDQTANDTSATTLDNNVAGEYDANAMSGDTTNDMNAMTNGTAGGGAVTVTVTGVRSGGGPVLVALQREGQFAQSAGAYTETVQPSGTSVTATFEGVAPGEYAAAAVQDTDGNGTFTIGAQGPGEPFGFSGTRQTGAPAFDPASFDVATSGGRATVALSGGAN